MRHETRAEPGHWSECRRATPVPDARALGRPHRSVLPFDVKKTPQFKVGDRVTVTTLPPNLDDRAQIDTPEVFRRALGKTFRVEGFGEYGHLELVVAERRPTPDTYESDTIFIEPEFVTLARRSRARK